MPRRPSKRKPARLGTPQIHKFGGAALADGASIHHVATILAKPEFGPAVVVASAMAGVTNALLALATSAVHGDRDAVEAGVAALRTRHLRAAKQVSGKRDVRELRDWLTETFDDLATLLGGVTALRELTPQTSDEIAGRGEQISARLVVAALRAAGRRAEYVDPLTIIRAVGQPGHATPDLRAVDRLAPRRLRPLLRRGVIPVVPGYIGLGPAGRIVTLGRGGSDLTATLLGRALKASRISLWKDVPGLLTADPRIVPDARVIPSLHVREAAELAYAGAKVLHPRALIPVARRRIPVYVRPFGDPSVSGTEVSARRTLSRYPVKALSAVHGQALLTVTGNGMLGVPGIAARTFAAMQSIEVSVSLISQASSEHSICLSVPDAQAERARARLSQEFAEEIDRREIDGIQTQRGVATLAIVGLGMAGKPGIAARLFSALAAGGVNIIAIAQGSSELNISTVVSMDDAPRAQRLAHAAFQLSKIGGGSVAHGDRTDLVLLGFGQIGRTLAGLLAKPRPKLAGVRVAAIIDRSGFVFDPDGIAPRRLAALAASKARGARLADIPGGHAASEGGALTHVSRHALRNPVLIDVTAEDTAPLLLRALDSGMDVVLANKRPLTGRRPVAEALRAAVAGGRRLLHETTVGAGLPIIDTYHKLAEAGDRVLRIEASASGTLGYLLSELNRGRRFSEALRKAMDHGYTEPDPREDLSGMDVARKALILGRLMGYAGELDEIGQESLVPVPARRLPLRQFLAKLEDYDAEWAERVRAAQATGGSLRYIARVTPRRITVGLDTVPAGSPFASLRGTDNLYAFTTQRYRANPLVITGAGAGPAVTAAGVLNDVLQLAGR